MDWKMEALFFSRDCWLFISHNAFCLIVNLCVGEIWLSQKELARKIIVVGYHIYVPIHYLSIIYLSIYPFICLFIYLLIHLPMFNVYSLLVNFGIHKFIFVWKHGSSVSMWHYWLLINKKINDSTKISKLFQNYSFYLDGILKTP